MNARVHCSALPTYVLGLYNRTGDIMQRRDTYTYNIIQIRNQDDRNALGGPPKSLHELIQFIANALDQLQCN